MTIYIQFGRVMFTYFVRYCDVTLNLIQGLSRGAIVCKILLSHA